MKRLNTLLLLGVLGAAPSVAPAADNATRMGFSLSARGAYAWPFGDLARPGGVAVKSSDTFERMIPLWADATLRLGGGVELGPYFQYGWISGKNGFSDAKDWRVGGQLNYRLTPAGGLVPWLGVGAGWEWLKFDNSGGFTTSNPDISGFDLMVQGGADFRLTPNVAIGPFVALTFGRFSSGTVFDAPLNSEKGWHEWLHVGAKLSLDL
jgi:hypothetical protein